MEAGAVSFSLDEPYTFSSGLRSPMYCDNRKLISSIQARKDVIQAFCQGIPKETRQIAGVATAGIPWACWIADQLDLPLVYVRSKPKEHGKKQCIEGNLILEETVLIEDMISTGNSSLEALDILRDEDVFVTQIAAILSYGFEETKNAFKECEIKSKTILEVEDLLAYAKDKSYLTTENIRHVLAWQKDPQNWKP